MKTIQAGVVALSALALAACGSGAKLGGGKQGAAQAAFQAGQASHGAPGALYRLLQDNVGGSLNATVQGDNGGSASIAYSTTINGTNTSLSMTITYNNFSEDGHDKYNGSWTVDLVVGTTQTTGNVQLTINGSLAISGDVDDTITAKNVVETIDVSALANGSASASVSVSGEIDTSTANYTYANDPFSFTASVTLQKGP